jgi:predicted XRE-type DNA-binding protein
MSCTISAMTANTLPPPDFLPGDLHAAIVGDLMAYMGRRRITQGRLAAAVGVDQATISRWLNRDMTMAQLNRVLQALGLTAELTLRNAGTGEVTVSNFRPYLRAIAGNGIRTAPRTPLLRCLPGARFDVAQ